MNAWASLRDMRTDPITTLIEVAISPMRRGWTPEELRAAATRAEQAAAIEQAAGAAPGQPELYRAVAAYWRTVADVREFV